MKKIILLILVMSTMIFAGNKEIDEKKLKTVTCKVTDVKRKIGNLNGTRVTCIDKNNKVYNFNESMINWKELETGKTYNIVYGQRIVKTNTREDEGNLYLFGFKDPEVKKVEQPFEEKVVLEKEIEINTVVLPFNCSNVENLSTSNISFKSTSCKIVAFSNFSSNLYSIKRNFKKYFSFLFNTFENEIFIFLFSKKCLLIGA